MEDKHYEPYCAFVTFENIHSKIGLLEEQGAITKCCFPEKVSEVSQEEEDDKLYKDQKLEFKACQMEPDGIVWENLNMSAKEKCVRCTLILFLMILFLVFAIIVFGIFAGSEASLYSDHYGHLRYQDIVNSNDPLKVKSFCIELSVTNISNYPECDPYFSDFVSYTILYVSFPLTVIIFKMIFALLMKKLVVLRRHKDEVYRICWKITILTLFYCSTCGGIKWFIYRSFSIGSFNFELLTLF